MQTQNESIDKKNEENIKDERGNIKKEIVEKIADNAIARNPLIYGRLAEI
jgi:hypothetical protein